MPIKLNSDILVEKVDDGFVLINPSSGQIRVLNATGSLIWSLLSDDKSVIDIQNELINTYQLSEDQAIIDVETFISDLHNRGLLTR